MFFIISDLFSLTSRTREQDLAVLRICPLSASAAALEKCGTRMKMLGRCQLSTGRQELSETSLDGFS